MKQTIITVVFAILCASSTAIEPKSEITIPLHDSVSEIVFRVVSVTSDPPEMHIIRQYTVLHSVTDMSKGLGFRITSHGHPSRIEAYQYDTKTGERVPRQESVNYILTNIHLLLLSDKPLRAGDEYVFSFQHYDGYHYLVDVKKRETKPPTTGSSLPRERGAQP